MNTDAFREAMQARGLRPPLHIEPGSIFRCTTDDKSHKRNGWGRLFDDGRGGIFGIHHTGLREVWQDKHAKPMGSAERKAFDRARREREAKERAKRETAAKRAVAQWNAASEAPADHPYLALKGVKAHGLRLHSDGRLIVPVRSGGELHSLQFIRPNGEKKFLPGSRMGGGYYPIGKPDGVLCIAEGFATGASIHEATSHAVAVAFDADNLLPVAKAMRAKSPDLRLILCADDDVDRKDNPGRTKARAAAEAVSGFVAVPDFGPNRPVGVTDFNDLAQHGGADAVRRCIERAEQVAPLNETDSMPCAILTRGDTIQIEPINWLWRDWLAAGKLHILAGAPGTGKTTLALAMAATVTTGGCWPDGTPAECGSVVMWSGEDDPADTLIPRLAAMGADRARVHFVAAATGPKGERLPFDPSRDVDQLSAAMANLPDARLLIVDPIVSAVTGDSHNNADTRKSLQPLVDLAAKHRCALLGITHLSKGTAGKDPVERVTGSIAFGAVARVVLMAAKKTAEDGATADTLGQRMLLRAKSNIGPDTGGYTYDLRQVQVPEHPDMVASSVRWGAAVEGNARELLAEVEQSPGDDATDAAGFLRELLTDHARPAKEIFAEAHGAGYSKDAMHRAKRKIGARARKQSMGGGWIWSLPTTEVGAEGGEDGVFLKAPPSQSSGAWLPPSGAVDL